MNLQRAAAKIRIQSSKWFVYLALSATILLFTAVAFPSRGYGQFQIDSSPWQQYQPMSTAEIAEITLGYGATYWILDQLLVPVDNHRIFNAKPNSIFNDGRVLSYFSENRTITGLNRDQKFARLVERIANRLDQHTAMIARHGCNRKALREALIRDINQLLQKEGTTKVLVRSCRAGRYADEIAAGIKLPPGRSATISLSNGIYGRGLRQYRSLTAAILGRRPIPSAQAYTTIRITGSRPMGGALQSVGPGRYFGAGATMFAGWSYAGDLATHVMDSSLDHPATLGLVNAMNFPYLPFAMIGEHEASQRFFQGVTDDTYANMEQELHGMFGGCGYEIYRMKENAQATAEAVWALEGGEKPGRNVGEEIVNQLLGSWE